MESQLLSDELAESIVATARTATGDSLRSVTFFTRSGFDQLYLRDDLERGADLRSFIGIEWREFGITQDAYENSELGGHAYTIRAFDNGYLLRVATEHDGIFITTDGLSLEGFEEIAAMLHEFLNDLPHS